MQGLLSPLFTRLPSQMFSLQNIGESSSSSSSSPVESSVSSYCGRASGGAVEKIRSSSSLLVGTPTKVGEHHKISTNVGHTAVQAQELKME